MSVGKEKPAPANNNHSDKNLNHTLNLDVYSEREFGLFSEESARRSDHLNQTRNTSIRYGFLLNGGAAVATMGLLASMGDSLEIKTLGIVGLGLMTFALGAASSAKSAYQYQKASAASVAELDLYWLNGVPFEKGSLSSESRKIRQKYEKASSTGVVFSHISFLIGVFIVGTALTLPSFLNAIQTFPME